MHAKKPVLVIDDEVATLIMFRLFLNAYGDALLTAENGETILRLARKHRPDMKIPGMSSSKYARKCKRPHMRPKWSR